MSEKKFDKNKLPSRHVSVGPERAPHRSYYYAMGMTEEDIKFRQGRSKRQYENNARAGGIAVMMLLATTLGIIIYGLITI